MLALKNTGRIQIKVLTNIAIFVSVISGLEGKNSKSEVIIP